MLRYILILFLLIITPTLQAQEKPKILGEVIIKGTTKEKKIKKKAIKVKLINFKKINSQPIEISDVLNATSGIRVRKSGGLGSNYNINLNGFQGKSIRYFKNGIDMNYAGSVFNLSAIPIGILQRIEVYKGVIPAYLASDVLGGAVNIVTNQKTFTPRLDVSFEVGSFNTKRFFIDGVWVTDNDFFFGVNSFYNTSNNDYKIDAPVINDNTATTEIKEVKLYHNKFSNNYLEFYSGVYDKSWVDNLRFSIAMGSSDKQHNYGSSMSKSYGGITGGVKSLLSSIRYKKKFFDKKLKVDHFFALSKHTTKYTDTIKGIYNWEGKFLKTNNRNGEASISGSQQKLNYNYFVSRTLLQYPINLNNKLILNTTYNRFNRRGEDKFGIRLPQSGEDLLSKKATYYKLAVVLGLTSDLCKKTITNQFLVKFFNLQTSGVDVSQIESTETYKNSNYNNFGFANAIKFKINSNFNLRLSAELASRLPDENEFFGNGNFILSNFDLKPERSLNLNFNLIHQKKSLKNELNLFYRKTKDMIRIETTGVFNSYKNIDNIRGFGIEYDISHKFLNYFKWNGNFTYQEFRTFGQKDNTYNEVRLPNMPYFFANLRLNFSIRNVFKKNDTFSVNWYYNYVKSFSTVYVPKSLEPDSFLGLFGDYKINNKSYLVPNQSIHNLNTIWKMNTHWSFGLGVNNIFNAKAFDEFKIQKPSRNINFKINYSIK